LGLFCWAVTKGNCGMCNFRSLGGHGLCRRACALLSKKSQTVRQKLFLADTDIIFKGSIRN